jgi:hypothetical protein
MKVLDSHPLITTLPSVGTRRPSMRSSKVLFPLPDGPSIASHPPSEKWKSTERSANSADPGYRYESSEALIENVLADISVSDRGSEIAA